MDAIHHTHSHSPTRSSARTSHRSFTSFTKHLPTKSTNSDDHPEEVSEGGSPKHTFFIICISLSFATPTCISLHAAYGFFPSANSRSEMPNDHTSLFHSVFPSYTSGAIYHDVPHVVFPLVHVVVSFTARPKSPSLITPFSEMNRLSGLMSYPIISTIHYQLCERSSWCCEGNSTPASNNS